MTIHIEKVGAGFVVSDDGAWVDGAYATEEAARLAVSIDPDQLANTVAGGMAAAHHQRAVLLGAAALHAGVPI